MTEQTMTTTAPMSRQAVVESLRGQTITVCDLNEPFASWPSEVNPNVDKLRQDVDVWLDRTMSHSDSLKALKASDFGFFGATWWPRAQFDRLRIVTYLAIWLFTWDDEIDSATGPLWEDFENSQQFRTETLDYVQYCLGLPSSDRWNDSRPSNQIICNFAVIGEAIRDAYNKEQRERVLQEMVILMQMSEKEQRLRLSGPLPSVDEFWRYRLGSSAVAVCVAVNEFAWGDMQLPRTLMKIADMKLLWDQTNIIISTVNDILSLKKEIARGSIDSLIPLRYAQLGDSQAAVDEVTRFLLSNIKSFEQTAQRLPVQASGADEKTQRMLQEFIDGCKYYCTGNLRWSLSTHRYGVNQEDMTEGVALRL